MKKQYTNLVLLTLWLLLAVTGCGQNYSGYHYIGGTAFRDSNLYTLLYLAIPITAYVISNHIKDEGFSGELLYIIGLTLFANFMMGGLASTGDPGEIQEKHYWIDYLIFAEGGGTVIGALIGAIRRA